MSNKSQDNDMDRYFNDPDYRHQKSGTQKKNSQSQNGSYFGDKASSRTLKWAATTIGIVLIAALGFFIYLITGTPFGRAA
ncbi:MAG: hypothetical protein U5J63_03705 [Fodinibius sp.]|nr:hypothetical protein [Fodinibius sp.]